MAEAEAAQRGAGAIARGRSRWARVLLAAGLLACVWGVLLGLSLGERWLGADELAGALASGLGVGGLSGLGERGELAYVLVWELRFPRVLCAVLLGAGLSLAGVLMQALFGNPLADGGIIGVSQAAALGGVLAVWLGLESAGSGREGGWTAAGWSVGGAVVCTLGLLALVGRGRVGSGRSSDLLLAGLSVNLLLSAVVALLVSLSLAEFDVAARVLSRLMGSLDGLGWWHAGLLGLGLGVSLGPTWWMRRALDLLGEGDWTARALGVDVVRLRLMLVLVSGLLTGVAVAVAGVVGFIGLVIPHVVRRLVGPGHGWLLVCSAVVGGAFACWADLFCRTARPLLGGGSGELALGVVTACVGAPLFMVLVLGGAGRRGAG